MIATTGGMGLPPCCPITVFTSCIFPLLFYFSRCVLSCIVLGRASDALRMIPPFYIYVVVVAKTIRSIHKSGYDMI